MLSKESKIRILENFYSLDYIFFGKPITTMETCCPAIKEDYLATKGALLSVIVEMFKLVDHKPVELREKVDRKKLMFLAKESAKLARENSKKIVVSEKARHDIKANLRENLKNSSDDLSKVVETAIREKAFKLAVDNLLVARTLAESIEPKKLLDWEGKILEDSYKILRDSLVESAITILDD